MKIGTLQDGSSIAIDESLEELIEACEDGIVTVQMVRELIGKAFGCSYEDIAQAVKESQ